MMTASEGRQEGRRQREEREEVDGPPVCERKREERVKGEKLAWSLARHGRMTWLETVVDSV